MTNKVVTVTLNPALDLTGNLERLNVGAVSLVESSALMPAGKGVNVAKVLSDLGADVTVTGFLGQDNAELFNDYFHQLGVNDAFVRVVGATRINVKLVEASGRVNDINFPGMYVNAEALAAFETRLFELASDHDYFVIAGSLPPGVEPELCAQWIDRLGQLGKKVLFDSSRAALKEGLEAKPWLIKPNEDELAEFVGRPLASVEECQEAALELLGLGITNIVVSMGAEGVMWMQEDGEWLRAKPPTMQVVSTVGAGDTFVAGMCWADMQAMEKHEALRLATALSAMAVTQVGVGITDHTTLERLQAHTAISRVEPI
ncbi:1-phosphofructokinase [Vibrio sp. SM6]|uniref:Phosphofructokinase n=1 Tax=Vibrio agarilyticus TaxID=2726741 RepID=A0A7X8TS90_9VIBR|nr:1-phosphofructokinase [Vibrio agarilyticus]NLS13303.1 1-phosphofructokinase [Vibrio agarilyticus]